MSNCISKLWKVVRDVHHIRKNTRIEMRLRYCCLPWVGRVECRVATSLKKSLKSLNLKPILEILERSLNFILNFGISLKSPWIVKDILEILVFCPQCDTSCTNLSNRRRYAAYPWSFEHPWKWRKYPWNILELSLNFVDRISWQPCKM